MGFIFSTSLADIVTSVPVGRLNNQKMMTLNDMVHSQLFLRPECRAIILPVVVKRVEGVAPRTCQRRPRNHCHRSPPEDCVQDVKAVSGDVGHLRAHAQHQGESTSLGASCIMQHGGAAAAAACGSGAA